MNTTALYVIFFTQLKNLYSTIIFSKDFITMKESLTISSIGFSFPKLKRFTNSGLPSWRQQGIKGHYDTSSSCSIDAPTIHKWRVLFTHYMAAKKFLKTAQRPFLFLASINILISIMMTKAAFAFEKASSPVKFFHVKHFDFLPVLNRTLSHGLMQQPKRVAYFTSEMR